jgi:hypothetical protein
MHFYLRRRGGRGTWVPYFIKADYLMHFYLKRRGGRGTWVPYFPTLSKPVV